MQADGYGASGQTRSIADAPITVAASTYSRTGLGGMAIAGITSAHGLNWALLLVPVIGVYLGGMARLPRLGRHHPKMA
jgi:hypothetical protein